MFSDSQLAQLRSPLDPSRIKERAESGKTFSYLDGEDVIRTANRIFGFGMWSSEALELTQTSQQFMGIAYKDGGKSVRPLGNLGDLQSGEKAGYTVGWLARVQVTVRHYDDGNSAWLEARYTDVGHGDGINMPSLAGANEFAAKEATTDALKRCLRFLGDQFGLTLWDKGQSHVGQGPADEATRKAYMLGMKKLGVDDATAQMAAAGPGGTWEAATADDLRAAYATVNADAARRVTAPPKGPTAEQEAEQKRLDEFKDIPKDEPPYGGGAVKQDPGPPAAYNPAASDNLDLGEPDVGAFATTHDLTTLAAVVKAKGVKNFQAIVQAEHTEHGGIRMSWLKEQLRALAAMENKS